jgi:hypothetical protein
MIKISKDYLMIANNFIFTKILEFYFIFTFRFNLNLLNYNYIL